MEVERRADKKQKVSLANLVHFIMKKKNEIFRGFLLFFFLVVIFF